MHYTRVLRAIREESLLPQPKRHSTQTTDSGHGSTHAPNPTTDRVTTTPSALGVVDGARIRLPRGFAYVAALRGAFARQGVLSGQCRAAATLFAVEHDLLN